MAFFRKVLLSALLVPAISTTAHAETPPDSTLSPFEFGIGAGFYCLSALAELQNAGTTPQQDCRQCVTSFCTLLFLPPSSVDNRWYSTWGVSGPAPDMRAAERQECIESAISQCDLFRSE